VESERFQLTRLGAAKLTLFPFRREPDCLLKTTTKNLFPKNTLQKSFKKQKMIIRNVEGFLQVYILMGFLGSSPSVNLSNFLWLLLLLVFSGYDF
jgi:hypothetical protein